MKTKEELENIKEEVKNLGAELQELSDDELEEVTGGVNMPWIALCIAKAPSLEFLSAAIGGVQTGFAGEPISGAQVMVKGTNNDSMT